MVKVWSVCAQDSTRYPNMRYDAAKAGGDAITRLAAVAFAKDGIRVNSVLPGGMATPGPDKMRAAQAAGGAVIVDPATIPGRNPVGPIAVPIEHARASLFPASAAASYVNRAELQVE